MDKIVGLFPQYNNFSMLSSQSVLHSTQRTKLKALCSSVSRVSSPVVRGAAVGSDVFLPLVILNQVILGLLK